MGYILRHSEDWTSYGTSITAVTDNTLAHPAGGRYYGPFDLYGSNAAGSGLTVGPTLGPNGGPGIDGNAIGGSTNVAVELAMTCRSFKIEALYDFTGWVAYVGQQTPTVFRASHIYPFGAYTEFSDEIFQIVHGYVTSGLLVTANTTGSVFTNYNTGMMAGIVPTTGNVLFRVEGRIATISGTAGSFSAASDGYLRVYINDVLVADTGAVSLWHWDANIPSANPGGSYSPYFNNVELNLHAKVGLWRVWASDDCVSGSSRNLLTGQGHTVEGNDNLIVGRTGTVDAADMVALFSLDEDEHTVATSKTFEVHADFINLNGTTTIGGGTAITDINAALDALGT